MYDDELCVCVYPLYITHYLGNSPDTLQMYSFSMLRDLISSPTVSASLDVLQISISPEVILSSLLDAVVSFDESAGQYIKQKAAGSTSHHHPLG